MKKRRLDIYITQIGARMGSSYYPCSIGRNGTTENKSEGDGATPTGEHEIIGLLYRADKIPRPTNWAVPIRPNDIWSDDLNDPNYNMMVRAPSSFSYEKLFRGDRLYDLVLLTNWNWPYAVKSRGSAIFLHSWRRPGFPTEGCIALDQVHLLKLVKRIDFGTKIIVLPRQDVFQK